MPSHRFATTQWSLVLAAGEPGSANAAEALARLCSLYWYPVYAFVRRQGHPVAEAEDLTQGFFARLIEKGDLGDADRARGRFRSFLLSSCRHFLSNERDRALATKRGGRSAAIPIDAAAAEARFQRALSNETTPETLYDRQWCQTILTSALDALRDDYTAAGSERVFDRLSGFLAMDDDAGTHAEAARDLGMSAGAVKVAVHRLRRRYKAAIRKRVADTVDSPDETEDELRYLLHVLGNSQA